MQDILRTERYNWTWRYTDKMNAWIQSLKGTCADPCTPPCRISNPSEALGGYCTIYGQDVWFPEARSVGCPVSCA